ncbi:hypothetical protein [Streptomyces sp. NPDC051577]|uniref:hypothetical protein n=1 Tax=Streptomyces sp. NPDC051577 TaxID=3155166 RepID=UPI00343CE0E9
MIIVENTSLNSKIGRYPGRMKNRNKNAQDEEECQEWPEFKRINLSRNAKPSTPKGGVMENKVRCSENRSSKLAIKDRNHAPRESRRLQKGRACVYNSWGAEINDIIVHHYTGGDTSRGDVLTWPTLWPGETTEWQHFSYSPSLTDYWRASFSVQGTRMHWASDGKFNCSLLPRDNGDVTISLDGYKKNLVVNFDTPLSGTVPLSPMQSRNLTRDPWLRSFHLEPSHHWIKDYGIQFVDFHYTLGDSFDHWRTGYEPPMTGDPNKPISVYSGLQNLSLLLPKGAPKDAGVVDLNGWDQRGFVEQDIPTTPGFSYVLTYWVGCDIWSGSAGHQGTDDKPYVGALSKVIDAYTLEEITPAVTTRVQYTGRAEEYAEQTGNDLYRYHTNPNWKSITHAFKAKSSLTRIRILDWTDGANNRPIPYGLTGADVTGILVSAAGAHLP